MNRGVVFNVIGAIVLDNDELLPPTASPLPGGCQVLVLTDVTTTTALGCTHCQRLVQYNITGMVAGHCQTRTLQIFWRLCCNDFFVTWRLNQIVLASTIDDGAWACTERSGTSLVVHLVDSTTAWFTKRSSQVLSHLGWRPAASKPAAPMDPGLRWLQTQIGMLRAHDLFRPRSFIGQDTGPPRG